MRRARRERRAPDATTARAAPLRPPRDGGREEGAEGLGGFQEVHGVAHRLDAKDFAVLTCMEHEYRCEEPSLSTGSRSTDLILRHCQIHCKTAMSGSAV